MSGIPFGRVLSAAAVALVALTGSAALAAETPIPRALDKADATTIRAAAQAPNARLVALVAANGKIIQSKGVDTITRINTGVYCVRPSASAGIDVSNSVAIVTVEWSYSKINEVMAQWARSGSGCGSDRFGVITLSDFNLNARYSRSNDAAFLIVVP
ncbi:MAG: hypothetical protein ACJ8AS_01055 [Hyphomicrobiales bacterium]